MAIIAVGSTVIVRIAIAVRAAIAVPVAVGLGIVATVAGGAVVVVRRRIVEASSQRQEQKQRGKSEPRGFLRRWHRVSPVRGPLEYCAATLAATRMRQEHRNNGNPRVRADLGPAIRRPESFRAPAKCP